MNEEPAAQPPSAEPPVHVERSAVGELLRAPGFEDVGEDTDPRFTFANERTFLAWNRTALALIAGGLAAAQFLQFHLHGLRLLIALPLIALGAMISIASYRHWTETERAMRQRRVPPYTAMPRILVLGIALIAGLGGIVAVIDRLVQ